MGATASDRAAHVQQVLTDLAADVDIAGCAVVTDQGLLLASALHPDAEASIGGTTAACLARAVEVARGLGVGQVHELSIRGEGGYLMFVRAGEDRYLLAVTRPEATLALAVLNARHAAMALGASR